MTRLLPIKEAAEALSVSRRTLERMISLGPSEDQWQDKEFIPHPSTWLHQRRWESDPPPARKKLNGNTIGSAPESVECDQSAIQAALQMRKDHSP